MKDNFGNRYAAPSPSPKWRGQGRGFGFYHLKIAVRNLRKNGLYSWINIGGLAVSLAAVLLILLWIRDERSFDKFHHRSKDIYVAVASFDSGSKQEYWALASPPVAGTAKAEIPAIEDACRILKYWNVEFLKNGKNVLTRVDCAMVDSSFFSIFDFQLVEGDRRNLLPDNYSVILTESAAKVLFGDENPIGKTVTDDSRRDFHVTGVMADMPDNSSNRYNVIFAFSLFQSLNPEMMHWWGNLNYKTYFMLHPEANAGDVAQKITAIHRSHFDWELTYLLHPLEKENLYNLDGSPNDKMQSCRLFLAAVAILLLIACINYVNLVTARASRRNKEVFVRGVLGARKWNMFSYFFNESLLLFFCALVIATVLIYLLFPAYNQVTGKQLEFHLFSGVTLALYGITLLAVMLLAGIYPAVFLSGKRRQAAAARRSGTNAVIRKTLVVTQFAASIILILGAITINSQMHYIKTKNPGYNKEHVFYVSLPQNIRAHLSDVKTRLMQVPGVEGVTVTNQPLDNVRQFNSGVNWKGKGDKQIKFTILTTDEYFIPTMGIQLTDGENFTGTPADRKYFILNQKAVAEMGLENPVGGQLFSVEGVDGTIIGVVEDFHFHNMHEAISPLIIRVQPWVAYLYVKAGAGKAGEAVQATETVYKGYNTDIPFAYNFADDEFDRIYKSDIRTGNLFKAFAVIAILVSCLGLFGLVTYTAETKTKEIGIRKVLGASVAGIVEMLSKEFLILVGVAMLVAFPLAYYWLDKMLQDYAYRIDISWWMFAAAGIITVALTLITVGWKAVKAATANPVKAIKAE